MYQYIKEGLGEEEGEGGGEGRSRGGVDRVQNVYDDK